MSQASSFGESDDHEEAMTTRQVASGETPRGLQIRCARCHHPFRIVVDAPLNNISCAVCPERFRLTSETSESHPPAQPVTTVAHFELIERLGIGSYGAVWKARDTNLGRTVALKIPRKGQLSPGEADKFRREARSAAQLRHPHIVTVHEIGSDGQSVYIVGDRGFKLRIRTCVYSIPVRRKNAELFSVPPLLAQPPMILQS